MDESRQTTTQAVAEQLLMFASPMIWLFRPVPENPGFRWKPSVHSLCKVNRARLTGRIRHGIGEVVSRILAVNAFAMHANSQLVVGAELLDNAEVGRFLDGVT